MNPTKLLVGQILVVLAIVIGGVWASTQWCAAMLGYQPELGAPWIVILDVPIYRPWAIFPWWYHFDAYAPEIFDKAGALAGASGFLGCAAAIFGALWRARQQRHVTTYGSARWAEPREIRGAGLLREAGVFLGRHHAHYLRHDGPEHVMAFAPTRSGKGVGLVVPTLLSWTGSAVIHDIKGENWQITAGWRARFSHVLRFDPTDATSAKYNPLMEVRRGASEVRDVQNIADILVDPVITTDRRVYHVQMTSTASTAMTSIRWTYPLDDLQAFARHREEADAAKPVSTGISIEQLQFNYRISGDTPAWRPIRAFDDGRQTWIEFPADLGTGEAPPLFVLGDTGEAELVNYRIAGRYYVVDRLFAAAELRLGAKNQKIVRITRAGKKSADRGRGA